jgi:formate dehydrogenase major subunit
MRRQDAQIYFCIPTPTDLIWLSAIGRYLLDRGLAHTKFLDQWFNGLEEYRKSLEPYTLEAAERLTGLSEQSIRTVAHMIAEAKGTCILWAMGPSLGQCIIISMCHDT